MAPLTPHDLIQWLVQNQFLSEARAQPFRSAAANYPDVMALARELIQRNDLTPYQLNQILQGKGDGLLLGPYRLLDKIGEGAMGKVFKAWNPKLELMVAIKMIHKEHLASKIAMDRFRREMETAGQLEHPNIVRLRDADVIDNHPFLIMNYVDGTDLSRLVKQKGPLPVGLAVEVIRQAALGLQHAFERGIIHRDIKPGNLLISGAANPVVKISDFGLARFESERRTEGRLTQFGVVLGTIDYIAPEQAENAQNADVRSDIYSLGCSLYYLLTAQPPFPGSTTLEKISARICGDPADIRSKRPEVPVGLSAVLKRMIARNPAERFQTPREVAAALQPFCVKEPPAAAVQQATTILLAGPAAAPAAVEDPFNFSNSDHGIAPASSASPQTSSTPPRRSLVVTKPAIVGYAVCGGLSVALLVFLLVRGWGSLGARHLYPPDAALEITLKEKGKIMKHGEHRFLLFEVARSKFAGTVEVAMEKLPDGVQAGKVLVAANKNQGQIPITVSFGTKSAQKQMRVKAIAKNLSAEAAFNLTVIGPDEVVPAPDDK